MLLRHSTDIRGAIGICKEGILSLADKKDSPKRMVVEGNPRYIYFGLTSGLWNYSSGWGSYSFFLNNDWVKSNGSQFRAYPQYLDSSSCSKYESFLRKHGIAIFDNPIWSGMFDYAGDIVSLEPIPLEGISYLVLSKSNLHHLKINGVNLEDIPQNIDVFVPGRNPKKLERVR